MRLQRGDILFPSIIIGVIVVVIIMVWAVIADAQTHTMPGSNVVPSGASLTINSGGTITAAAGSTVTGFGGAGGGNVSNTGTPLLDQVAIWTNATTLKGVTTIKGGTINQVLKKNSSTDYDYSWAADATGGSPTWGTITGTLSAQTDLQTALDAKLATLGDLSPLFTTTEATQNGAFSLTNAAATTVFGRAAGTSGAPTYSSAPQFLKIGNLTTNGFVKTGSSDGTLSVDTGTYQGTLTNSAGLRGALSDENGTGAALFNAATTPDFTTGITIGGAAASGKILKGNGTNFVPSTETYAAPGTSGNVMKSDGTNWTSGTVTAAPGGSTTQLQYNNAGALGGAPITYTVPSSNTEIAFDLSATGGLGRMKFSVGGGLSSGYLSDSIGSTFFSNGAYYNGTNWTREVTAPGSLIAVYNGGLYVQTIPTGTAGTTTAATQALLVYNSGGVQVGTGTDPGAGYLDVQTGYKLGGAAASGKILQGNGTGYVASTPTWPTTAGTAAYTVRSDGTNFTSYPQDMLNSSTVVQVLSTSDVYIAGSSIVVAAGDFKAKGQYRCLIEATKSAGTGNIIITLRIGTAGTTSDASIQTYTFGAGTSTADTATFEIIATFRTVGSGTSAVVNGICRSQHNLENTGMYVNTVPSVIILGSPLPSAGFATNAATTIGVSFNGGTAFNANCNLVQAQLIQ